MPFLDPNMSSNAILRRSQLQHLSSVFVALLTLMAVCLAPRTVAVAASVPMPMAREFAGQPAAVRPPLEVRYADATRTAFEVVAADYRLLGSLRDSQALREAQTGALWLELSVVDGHGRVFRMTKSRSPSRINLYRRGPYYCEIHWLDVTLADDQGQLAPLKGDLALYAYPDQLLGSVTWHATGDFDFRRMKVAGKAERAFDSISMAKGEIRRFDFPIHGVRPPLSAGALRTGSAAAPLVYDLVRGCYTIGTRCLGSFEAQFYDHPNDYERADFEVQNDATDRTIYICHRTSEGPSGLVEGGVLLDPEGHPLPITVQISKNFAGEIEEKFYNPTDEPFSETWFPLVMGPGDHRAISSLHLYQNWGRHMVKQFSSLGAWMDYFHSSSGVTETTCYVPFKFGGLSGIDIADFRAMSQPTFWGDQPQHDNVAGHSFLSYHDGVRWQYLEYRGTTYTSTGPNWMDITLHYLSSDGKVQASVRTFELPQRDEVRNFVNVTYQFLAPLSIRQAPEHFRLLTAGSRVQSLRQTSFAATGMTDRRLRFDTENWDVRGVPLPGVPSSLAVYGDPKGGNALVLRRWNSGLHPAASVLCSTNGDTRLCLVPAEENLEFKTGDILQLEAMLLPFGDTQSAAIASREVRAYGIDGPRLVGVARGVKVSDFPTEVRADGNRAEFTVAGGLDLIPILVTGLSDYRSPRLLRKTRLGWEPVGHSRVGSLDGVQTYSQPDGRFGAVMLVEADSIPQTFRFDLKGMVPDQPRLKVLPSPQVAALPVLVLPLAGGELQLNYPAQVRWHRPGSDWTVFGDGKGGGSFHPWKVRSNPGPSVWVEARSEGASVGGRISPNERDADLEFWVRNTGEGVLQAETWFGFRNLIGAQAEDSRQVQVRIQGQWRALSRAEVQGGIRLSVEALALAIPGRGGWVGLTWPGLQVQWQGDRLAWGPAWPEIPSGRRGFLRGKLIGPAPAPSGFDDALRRFLRPDYNRDPKSRI